MSRNSRGRVLAIALDAAEPSYAQRLIERDEMPALKSLLTNGRWLRVRSPAEIGSGCVWPTFASGKDPRAHGVYGEWSWQPDAMRLVRYEGNNFEPFWKNFSERGLSVGVLDPPFVKPVGVNNGGFEIVEWGPHDMLGRGLRAHPTEVADLLNRRFPPHPFSNTRSNGGGASRASDLARFTSSCVQGVNLRGSVAREMLAERSLDFALVTFTEIHHGAHRLWHAHDKLQEIYREVDRQIASLIQTVGADDQIIVFSLHGMRSAAGVPAFLQSLLHEKGFARVAGWKSQSVTERARSLLAEVKRSTPEPIKKLYYRTITKSAAWRVAGPTMMPVYDWSQTRAFSLPTDQHGWIRINLKGRERAGITQHELYDATCSELERLMRGLHTQDGRPLVSEVIRTVRSVEEAKTSLLPDLVVHWADPAFADGASIRGSAVEVQTISKHLTGEHAPDGFCILSGGMDVGANDQLLATDMHSLISRSLT